MIRIHEIKLKLGTKQEEIPAAILRKLNRKDLEIGQWNMIKESLDARDKGELLQVYSVDFEVRSLNGKNVNTEDERAELEQKLMAEHPKIKMAVAPDMTYHYVIQPSDRGKMVVEKSPVVVGFGPCGMFAALLLAQMGLRPVVLERGASMDQRTEAVERFWNEGILDVHTNVQFGEGGAGAFSDGKLTSQIKDPRVRKVLDELVQAGGDEELRYQQKPHIGTDVLRHVVTTIRHEILRLGGTVRFRQQVTGLQIHEGAVSGVVVGDGETIACDYLVLALGHSARDTMEMLYETGMKMEQKPFSMGVRIEHPQTMVNVAQYGKNYEQYRGKDGKPLLGAADYKLTHHCKDGRGVYTFCMCPGGRVIAAASEEGQVVTNGMSYHSRNLENANSGLLVDVKTEDYGSDHPLAGMAFQRKYERFAYQLGGATYGAPVQRVGDFLKKKATTPGQGAKNSVRPSYVPETMWTDVSQCLPDFVTESIREALPQLGRKLRGFDHPDGVMTAIESRSSSPVRVLRNEGMESSIIGIYPGGEGAGYAGGITSSAVDGIKIAEEIAKRIIEKTGFGS